MSEPSFACPRCGAVSDNPNDVRERYCACQRDARPTAGDPYLDDALPERPCERCGKPYRGPALYCSLECALADA